MKEPMEFRGYRIRIVFDRERGVFRQVPDMRPFLFCNEADEPPVAAAAETGGLERRRWWRPRRA